MARRCVNDGSPGLCCTAVSQLGTAQAARGFQHPDARTGKMRCHSCTVIQRTKGRGQGFQHRFLKNSACGIISGCAVLTTGGGTPGTLSIPIGQSPVPTV